MDGMDPTTASYVVTAAAGVLSSLIAWWCAYRARRDARDAQRAAAEWRVRDETPLWSPPRRTPPPPAPAAPDVSEAVDPAYWDCMGLPVMAEVLRSLDPPTPARPPCPHTESTALPTLGQRPHEWRRLCDACGVTVPQDAA